MFPKLYSTITLTIDIGWGEEREFPIKLQLSVAVFSVEETLVSSSDTVAFTGAKAECAGSDVKGIAEHVGRAV